MKKIFYSKLWGLMLPIVLQNLMLALVAVADAFIQACTCIDEVGKLPWVLHHFRKYKWVKDLTH